MARVLKFPKRTSQVYIKTEAVCDKYCHDCSYYRGAWEHYKFCHYYLLTSKRRPCDPGMGCTVKSSRKKGRKKGAENAG